jgi:hypothetical protein
VAKPRPDVRSEEESCSEIAVIFWERSRGSQRLPLLLVIYGASWLDLLDSGPGPEIVISGVRYLYFGGTGYFGFQTHPEVLQAKAVADFGVC